MRAHRFWAFLCVACWPAAAIAVFDPTDVIQVYAGVGFAHDSNLFRLPDLDPRLFGIDPANKSDTILIKSVGLKFDKLVSRQRLRADIDLYENTYDNNQNLDFFGGTARFGWGWQIGNYWHGEASYRRERRLGGFEDFRQNVQDLIDTDTFTLNGGYQFHPRWRVSAEISDYEATHSAPARRTLDVNSKSVGAWLTYQTPSNNSIGLMGRRTERNYPNRVSLTLDNNHTENRLNVTALWQPSETFRVDGQFGYTEIEHERLAVRDFSGATWLAGATWDATAKLQLNLKTSRGLRLYEDNATSYIVVDTLEFVPVYAVTPKLSVQGEFRDQNWDYRGNPLSVLTPLNREDKVRTARLSVNYSPLRNVAFSLSYEHGERKSNIQFNDYEYYSWFSTVRVSF